MKLWEHLWWSQVPIYILEKYENVPLKIWNSKKDFRLKMGKNPICGFAKFDIPRKPGQCSCQVYIFLETTLDSKKAFVKLWEHLWRFQVSLAHPDWNLGKNFKLGGIQAKNRDSKQLRVRCFCESIDFDSQSQKLSFVDFWTKLCPKTVLLQNIPCPSTWALLSDLRVKPYFRAKFLKGF
jgi:hypothetical protein